MAKVLIIGSGGREHALAYKLNASPLVERVYMAPGSTTVVDDALPIAIDSLDFPKLIDFAIGHGIDLTIVGPEVPLSEGIVDAFQAAGLTIFGPTQAAARLESSKAFCKAIMAKYDIPTARYDLVTTYDDGCAALEHHRYPLVIKASGLAAGKGVIIAENKEAADDALRQMMVDHSFASAGDEVVIEEFLAGEEFSLLCLCQDEVFVPLQVAQDHKRAFDHDQGLNTGGMGAYTPVDSISAADVDEAVRCIIKPMLAAMVNEGHPFSGVLYAGLMKTSSGIQVIEFNVRFGDPETEVIMPALQSDLYEVLMALMNHQTPTLKWSKSYYIGAVMAAKGYPEAYRKGAIIKGTEKVTPPLFHMGTRLDEGRLLSDGGRVLFVGGHGESLKKAREMLYHELSKIQCDDLFYRHDIGFHNLKEKP